jgi:acetyl-CoA C-acetyltransferase
MKEVVILSACRTAIGKYGGSLAPIPATQLGAIVIAEAIMRARLEAGLVDEVYLGQVLQAGAGQGPARQAAILAGIPQTAPATTLNNICGSGLKAIALAAGQIRAGDVDTVVAGGMENMSAAPYALMQARFGYRLNDGQLLDTLVHDALTDAFEHYHMGITAENVARDYQISRAEQDHFAANSQQKAEKAILSGIFDAEIVPVPIQGNKKETSLFRQDEYPRPGVTGESLAKLKPAFQAGGTVTAGNSSGMNVRQRLF